MIFKPDQKIVFIGDSITEDGRFQDPRGLGFGYVRLIHDYIYTRYPDLHLNILNKGVSGNRITDLAKRWHEDVIHEAPDWVSVSIGINDVWRQLDKPAIEQVYPAEFEQVYRQLLTMVKEKTNAQIIIMDPTIIDEDVHSEGNQLLKEYVQITKQLSHEFQTMSIPMHEKFIQYVEQYPENDLTNDGVHMNTLGRMLMAVTWLEGVYGDK